MHCRRPATPTTWCVLLVACILLVLLPGSCHAAWPWRTKHKPDISSSAQCRAASKGHVYQGDGIYPALQVSRAAGASTLQDLATTLLPAGVSARRHHSSSRVGGSGLGTLPGTLSASRSMRLSALHIRAPPCLQSWFKVNGPPVLLPKNMTDITTAATIIQLAVPHLKLVLDPMLFLKSAPKPKGIPKVIHMTLRSKHSLAPHQILSIVSWGWCVTSRSPVCVCLCVSVCMLMCVCVCVVAGAMLTMLHNCKAATLTRLCARAVLRRAVLRRVMCRYNKGYSLLLYDNKDINAYMRTYYPGFVPCEWESAEGWDGMHGMWQWVRA